MLAVGEGDNKVVPVEGRLFKALSAAGIQKPDDDGRLSTGQLDALLAGKEPGECIRIKLQCQRNGIYPRA
jgi:hypothetical protein